MDFRPLYLWAVSMLIQTDLPRLLNNVVCIFSTAALGWHWLQVSEFRFWAPPSPMSTAPKLLLLLGCHSVAGTSWPFQFSSVSYSFSLLQAMSHLWSKKRNISMHKYYPGLVCCTLLGICFIRNMLGSFCHLCQNCNKCSQVKSIHFTNFVYSHWCGLMLEKMTWKNGLPSLVQNMWARQWQLCELSGTQCWLHGLIGGF